MSTVSGLGMSYLNESPMFLALKGRNKEARSVVESMGRLESSTCLAPRCGAGPGDEDSYKTCFRLAWGQPHRGGVATLLKVTQKVCTLWLRDSWNFNDFVSSVDQRIPESCFGLHTASSGRRLNKSPPSTLDFEKPCAEVREGTLFSQMSRQMTLVFSEEFIAHDPVEWE